MNEVVDAGRTRAAANEPAVHGLARLLPAVSLAALLVVDAILLANAVHVLRAGITAIPYPFELDFGEGLVLAPTQALAAGHALYPPASEAPTLINPYTPLYYATAAVLGSAMGDHLAAGRALSLSSAMLAAVVLAGLVWRALDPTCGRRTRGLAAACAGLAFLQISYTASWAALMRVDLLAVLLAIAGVWVFGATAARGNRVYWCLVPFLLAAYTRQTTVAAAAACVVTLARGSRRRGLWLGNAFAAAALLVGAVLQIATRGGFAFHVIVGNLQPLRWDQAASFLQDIAIRYPVLVALAVAIAPALLRSLPRGGADPSAGGAARNWTRAALGMYLPFAACISLTVGKLGADVNYLIEVMGVVCACAAVGVGEALTAARPAHSKRDAAAIAAVAVPALLLWQVIGLAPPAALESVELPPAAEQARLAELLDVVRRAAGPVLSEDLTLLSRADQPIHFDPFNATQLIYADALDQAPLIGALERSEFRLVVLRFDVRTPPPLAFDRFPPAAIEMIRTHYRPHSTFPGYWLYVPSKAS